MPTSPEEHFDCEECGYRYIRIEMRVYKNGQVRFVKDCERCGGVAGYWRDRTIERAVAEYLKTQKQGA